MIRISRLLIITALLPALYCTQAGASANLPRQELDLATLDLNGTPFRYFHLGRYRGWVLNPKAAPAKPRVKHLDVLRTREVLQQMPAIVGLQMLRPRYPNGPDTVKPIVYRELQGLYREREPVPHW